MGATSFPGLFPFTFEAGASIFQGKSPGNEVAMGDLSTELWAVYPPSYEQSVH